MWTAKITEKVIRSDGIHITVEYSNDNVAFTQNYTTQNAQSPSWLADQIVDKIDVLEALEDYGNSLEVGSIDVVEYKRSKKTRETEESDLEVR